MREEAFRRFLAPSLTPRSVSSYLADARRFERDLGLDLDAAALDEDALEVAARRLRLSGCPENSVRNIRAAVRRYREMRG